MLLYVTILGFTETEIMAIQQKVQQICDYYKPVYTLQERYRNLEAYKNSRDRITVVLRAPTSSPLATVVVGLGTVQVHPVLQVLVTKARVLRLSHLGEDRRIYKSFILPRLPTGFPFLFELQ